jgi:cardiolipin synthase
MSDNNIKKAIPNTLTLFRCLISILLPILIIYGGETGAILAAPLLLLAGLSDYFDGFFARKYNVVSILGKVLDPIADKLLVIGVLLSLASENLLDFYFGFIPSLIIILREIFISGLRESVSSYNFTLKVSVLAKWKTTIQLIACGSFLVWRMNEYFYNIDFLGFISYCLLWLASIITLITGFQYAVSVINFFKKNNENS